MLPALTYDEAVAIVKLEERMPAEVRVLLDRWRARFDTEVRSLLTSVDPKEAGHAQCLQDLLDDFRLAPEQVQKARERMKK